MSSSRDVASNKIRHTRGSTPLFIALLTAGGTPMVNHNGCDVFRATLHETTFCF